MAMQSTSKAVGLSRDLHDRLALRTKGSASINTIREAMDAQGWPMLFCSVGGNEAAGQPVIGIRIKNIDVGAVDNFGNATLPFAPHNCEIAYELNGAGAPTPSAKDLVLAVVECSKMGTIISQEAIANATAVSEASMNASSPISVIKDIDWSNLGNV
jgi:hypothetical protein